MTKTFKKWQKRVNDLNTPWTETEIIYFRKFVGHCGHKNRDERWNLIYEVEHNHKNKGYHISPEQSEKGINYLKNTILKKNNEYRQSKKAKTFNDKEKEIILNFAEFRFVGLYKQSINQADFFTPIYRVIDRNGKYFDYTTNMGNMEVTSVRERNVNLKLVS